MCVEEYYQVNIPVNGEPPLAYDMHFEVLRFFFNGRALQTDKQMQDDVNRSRGRPSGLQMKPTTVSGLVLNLFILSYTSDVAFVFRTQHRKHMAVSQLRGLRHARLGGEWSPSLGPACWCMIACCGLIC
jgi:hypothetical protein